MKKLNEISSLEELAQYIADNYSDETYVEHEGVVYPSIFAAYVIASRISNHNERREYAFLPAPELKEKITEKYSKERSNKEQIMETILTDKICGCKSLCIEFLSVPQESWQGEFGMVLKKIYPKIQARGSVRYKI